jgi:hypothetical protein
VSDTNTARGSGQFLSLRWKSLIALALALFLVNTSLALIANYQLVRQFERHQHTLREQQDRQLRALVEERGQEMSKLASLVPILGNEEAHLSPSTQIAQALATDGALLDLEWDIRSIHWISPDGVASVMWPEDAPRIPSRLLAEVRRNPEQTTAALLCHPECRQYKVTPLLWQGAFVGNLVLSRSLADALLTFHALTQAEVAIIASDDPHPVNWLDPSSPRASIIRPAKTECRTRRWS